MAEMRPGDVPTEYVEVGADTIHAHYAANPDDESEENAIRILLAAVLPLHEKQLRTELTAEYGYRWRDEPPGEDPNSIGYDDEATARLMAAPGDTIWRRYKTGWKKVTDDA